MSIFKRTQRKYVKKAKHRSVEKERRPPVPSIYSSARTELD